MFDKSLKELASSLASKDFSSVELTQAYLDRAKELNTSINAFVTIDEEQSLAQARSADQKLRKEISRLSPESRLLIKISGAPKDG